MTPNRVASWATRWVRLYTAGLPDDVAARRRDEIASDLHEQIDHERSAGVADRTIAARIASRTIRGAAADVAWRGHESRSADNASTREHRMHAVTLARSARRVGAVIVVSLAIPLVATFLTDEMDWTVVDFALAGTLIGVIGVCVETAIRRRGNLLIAGAVVGLGTAAAIGGELDDAPGLVVLGALMVAGGAGIAVRRARLVD